MNSIYALTDPLTNEIRYIGKTRNVARRHTAHCNTKSKTHVSHWVQRLKERNLFPNMIVIESGLSEMEWPEAEQFWIEYYKSYGARLANITKGGHDVVSKPYDTSIFEVYICGRLLYIQLTPREQQRRQEMLKRYARTNKRGKATLLAKDIMRPRAKSGSAYIINPLYACMVTGGDRAEIYQEYLALPAPPQDTAEEQSV